MSEFFSKIHKIHYERKPAGLLLLPLWVASLFYGAMIRLKNFLYERRVLKSTRVNAGVICVGNLTTGGVGKTPVVCELANHLIVRGKRVAILSRGYGGKLSSGKVVVVKNMKGEILVDNPSLCGDEPYLILQNTVGAAVLICKNRVKAAKYAADELGAEILIMDDGFSNRTIHKDLNVLLIDSQKIFGNEKLLPLGPLREPVCEVKRADRVVLVNKGMENFGEVKEIVRHRFGVRPITCDMKIDKIYNPKTGVAIEFEEDASLRPVAFAFSAIGQPEQFYAYLKESFNLVDTKTFKDHHAYTRADIEKIIETAAQTGAKYIITTQKDYVKVCASPQDGGGGGQPSTTSTTKATCDADIFVLKLKQHLNIEEILSA